MCNRLCLLSVVSALALMASAQAGQFSDNFDVTHNYLTDGLGAYAGTIGTFDVLDANGTCPGGLYMRTTNASWDPGPGPMLYLEVTGDFVATVKVVDFAGTLAAPVFHNDSGIVARDPAGAPGKENWVSMNYFPTWTAFVARNTVDSVRAELGQTAGTWTGADTFAIVALHPWIQLERKGDDFFFRISADGVTFLPLTDPAYLGLYDGTQTPLVVNRPDLPDTLQVGLINATYDVTTGYVAFDDFSIVTPAEPKANIILVTETLDVDADGVRDDKGLEDWLVAEGYSVEATPGKWTVLDPNKIAALNAADLVLISRATSSGNYDDSAEEIASWNAVTTPILNLTAYLVRNNRWKWVNNATATSTTVAPLLMAVDLNHPVFAGVMLDQDGIAEVLDATVGTGITSFISTLDMGNGKLIAQAIGGDLAWIAEWPAGVEYYAGAGQYAGGKRMLLCAGTQEAGATPQGAFNLNEAGRQLLRNAIGYLLAPEPPLKVIYVTSVKDNDKDGVQDDQSWIDWLTAEGYDVDARPGNWSDPLDANEIAALNAADLIIASRGMATGDFDGAETPKWNGLTTPILCTNAWMIRNNRWKWLDSGSAVKDAGSPTMMVLDPSHPIFAGVTLDPDGLVEVLDPNVYSGHTSFLSNFLDPGNGTLLAQSLGLYNTAWIVEWQPGVEYYAGAAEIAGGKRMLFMAATQDDPYTVANGNIAPVGVFNLNEAGQQLLRNIIAYLTE
jgi:hypothetical protein